MFSFNVNYIKTNIVIFNSRTNRNVSFSIGGNDIAITDTYKYLGLIFSKSGSFLQSKKHIVQQAKKAAHLLLIRANNLNIPLDLQIKLFDNTVLPILTYGCEIFGYENIEILERVHLEFLRKIGKLRKNTPKYMIYAEMGRYPLNITVKQRMINYWVRILTGKSSKLSYQIYSYILKSNEINSKWVCFIQSVLCECGRQDLWLRQSHSIPASVGKIVKRTMLDQFQQNWNGNLQTSSKGRNYSLYQDNILIENYINILHGSLVIAMLKFRTANHKLPIEVGRWNDTDLRDRKCQLCQSSSIGDEFHYLLECSFFKKERKTFVDQYFFQHPNIIKYKELLGSKNESKLINLAKFMKIIMNQFA